MNPLTAADISNLHDYELETYNALLPGEGEIAATLFIEITDQARIQPILDELIGLDEPGRLKLRIGEGAYPALFAPGQSREDRISAVYYIRFRPGAEGRAALSSGAEAALEVAHGAYRERQVLARDRRGAARRSDKSLIGREALRLFARSGPP